MEIPFLERQARMLSAMKNIDDADRLGMIYAIDSTHFIDYNFTVDHMMKIIKGKTKLAKSKQPFVFDYWKEDIPDDVLQKLIRTIKSKDEEVAKEGNAFKNYLDTRKYLINEKPDLTTEEFQKMHKMMMKGGVEKTSKDMLGKFNGDELVGMERIRGISDDNLKTVNESPYLNFTKKMETTNVEGVIRHHGDIEYLTIKSLNDELIKRIKNVDPSLAKKAKKAKETMIKENVNVDLLTADEFDEFAAKNEKLLSNIKKTLVEERFGWFKKERKLLGSLDDPDKLDKFIELVANLQRDVVAIHPFSNGNGRVTREYLINYLLMKEGLPPPRLVDPNIDYLAPLSQWKDQITRGMEATNALYDDIHNRIKLGLAVENSPELLIPYSVRKVLMKTDDSEEVTKANMISGSSDELWANSPMEEKKEFFLDNKQFHVFTKHMMEKDPKLAERIKSNPYDELIKLEKKYQEFVIRNNRPDTYEKTGTIFDDTRVISLNFADEDFISKFANKSFRNKEDWDAKMKLWYSDKTIWRGIPEGYPKSDNEIKSMFKHLNQQTVSVNVYNNMFVDSTPDDLRKLVIKEFKRYNQNLFDGTFAKSKVNDQVLKNVEANIDGAFNDFYQIGYGYSTSNDLWVADKFASGFLKDGNILKHGTVVGMKKAKKDIDATSLQKLRKGFKYKLTEAENEVVGIGGIDPDSIMVIHQHNRVEKTITSYLRNPEKPHEIVVVKGKYDGFSKDIPQENILRKLDLNK